MNERRLRSERSELSEPTEPAPTPGTVLRSLFAQARPPLLQKVVARRLGVSPGTVSDWLRDRHVPRADHLDRLGVLLADHGIELERGQLSEQFRSFAREADDPSDAGLASLAVPVPLTAQIGRDDDVERVLTLWAEHRLVCIIGPTGVGKTRLAVAVADRINEKRPKEVHWLQVASARSPEDLYQLFALALQARTPAGSSTLGSIARVIGDQRCTVVLDSLDELDDGGSAAVVPLLERCAGLRIIVSARRGEPTPGAALYRLEPLAVPDDDVADDEAREYPAIRLFGVYAMRAGVDDAVERAGVRRISAICRALGGLPFCFELAAAQLDTVTLHELHEQLVLGPEVGTSLRTSNDNGDVVLDKALRSSWNRLSPLAKRAVACCSVFGGSFDSDRAMRVTALTTTSVTAALHELVRASMVQVDHSRLNTTYQILGPLRHFASQRLAEIGDESQVRDLHAHHVAELLAAEFPLSHSEAFERIGWSDLRGALRWSVSRDGATGLRIAGNLWPQWLRVGAFAIGRDWLDRALENNPGQAGSARAIVGAGALALMEGDREQAQALLTTGASGASTEGDDQAGEAAMIYLGWLALFDGRALDGERNADEILARASPGELRWSVGAAHNLRGSARMLRDDPGAEEDLEQGLSISTSIGNISGAVSAQLQLSRLALDAGSLDQAIRHARAGLADAQRTNDRSLTGAALVAVGIASRADGRLDDAVVALERAVSLMAGSEEPAAQCRSLLELASARASSGGSPGTEPAIADILEATDIAIEHNLRVLFPLCFSTMAEVVGDADARWLRNAAELIRQHVGLRESPPDPTEIADLVDQSPESSTLVRLVELVRVVLGLSPDDDGGSVTS